MFEYLIERLMFKEKTNLPAGLHSVVSSQNEYSYVLTGLLVGKWSKDMVWC